MSMTTKTENEDDLTYLDYDIQPIPLGSSQNNSEQSNNNY